MRDGVDAFPTLVCPGTTIRLPPTSKSVIRLRRTIFLHDLSAQVKIEDHERKQLGLWNLERVGKSHSLTDLV